MKTGNKRKAEDDLRNGENSKNLRLYLDARDDEEEEDKLFEKSNLNNLVEYAQKSYEAYHYHRKHNFFEEAKTEILFEDLKKKYKAVLKEVYRIYSDLIGFSNELSIFKTYDSGEIFNVDETVDEFIDNFHPLWKYDRQVYEEMGKNNNSDSQVLADHVHNRWGRNDINPRSSLSFVMDPSVVRQEADSEKTNRNAHMKPLEREWARKRLFREKVFQNGNQNYEYSPSDSTDGLLKCDDVVAMMNKEAEENNWAKQRRAEVEEGIKDAASITGNFTGGDTRLSKEQAETIRDNEETYGMILELSGGWMNPEILEES